MRSRTSSGKERREGIGRGDGGGGNVGSAEVPQIYIVAGGTLGSRTVEEETESGRIGHIVRQRVCEVQD